MRIRKSFFTSAIVFMILVSATEFVASTSVALDGRLRLNSLVGVVDAQTTVPITGAMVVATGSNGSGFAITGSYGSYQIVEGLGTGEYSVIVTARGYVDAEVRKVQVAAGQETSGLNFFLRRSGAISGKVTGLGDKPLKGVLVYATQISGTGGNGSSYALTDEDGSYMIYTGLSRGTYDVTAGLYMLGALGENVGYIPNKKSGINVVEGQETSKVNFQLGISGTISGKVTTGEGVPLKGVMVAAASSDGKYSGFGFTGAGGNYKISSGLGTGDYTVITYKGILPVFKFHVLVTAGQETPNINFEISIPPSGAISGTVTDTSGNPIGNATVYASGPEGSGEGETDENGYYTISEGIGTGNYTVYASAPGYNPSSPVNVSVRVNQETKGVNFQLQKISGVVSGKISGQVTGEPNPIMPLPALAVTATASPAATYSGGPSMIKVSVRSNGTPISAATVAFTSNKGGSFSAVTDHANGTYTATFTAPTVAMSTVCIITASGSKSGYVSGLGQIEVTVQPLQALVVTATASPVTTYSGGTSMIRVFVTSGGTAATGATVSLTSDKGGVFSAVTDHANGTYTAGFTAPDITIQTTCTIAANVSKPGYISISERTQVTLQPLILNVYVRDTDGSPVAGVTVVSTSQPSGQTPLSGTTDANGLARLTGVLKGSYTIKASKTGYEDKTLTVIVAAGQMATETITMSKPPEFPWIWVITGIVAISIMVGALFAMKKRKTKA